MSVSYWGIVGYGIDLDNIAEYLNKEKVNLLVRKNNPKEIFEEDVFEDDTFYGNPYSGFGEFLSELDETNTIGWNNSGNTGKDYFLYEPKYPWTVKNNDPTGYEDVENRIIKALLKVYDITEEEIKSKIGYIDDYGCG